MLAQTTEDYPWKPQNLVPSPSDIKAIRKVPQRLRQIRGFDPSLRKLSIKIVLARHVLKYILKVG